jgi:predicted nucleic acid-binding protein
MAQRIVIDTNVFVSALRSSRGASHRLLTQVGDRGFEIALSVPLVVEYEDVAKRQTDVTGLTYEDVDDITSTTCAAWRTSRRSTSSGGLS